MRNSKGIYIDILPKHMFFFLIHYLVKFKKVSGNLLFKCFKTLRNVTFQLVSHEKCFAEKVTNYQRVHFCIIRSLSLVLLLTHKNPFHNLQSNLLHINFNFVFPATSTSLRFS